VAQILGLLLQLKKLRKKQSPKGVKFFQSGHPGVGNVRNVFRLPDNIADTYSCGDTNGVSGCVSDAKGINVVCHCDSELCNVFSAGRRADSPAHLALAVAAATAALLLTQLEF
jgi:hypothetical protein